MHQCFRMSFHTCIDCIMFKHPKFYIATFCTSKQELEMAATISFQLPITCISKLQHWHCSPFPIQLDFVIGGPIQFCVLNSNIQMKPKGLKTRTYDGLKKHGKKLIDELPCALWGNRTSPSRTIEQTPFFFM
jgi:hypothetical protein